MVKRIADLLEKFGVGSGLIGVYQGNWLAMILGIISPCGGLYMTEKIK